MSNPWFRLHADMLSDEKVLSLAFSDRWFFVAVMCLKCEGMQDKYDGENLDRKVAIRLGISRSEAEELKARLMAEGLICGNWIPVAWDKRQYKSDSSAERVARHRAKQKQQDSDVKRSCNVTVTPPDTDTDTENRYSETVLDTGDDFGSMLFFEDFWEAFKDKRGKDGARRVWKRRKLHKIAGEVIAGAVLYAKSRGPDRRYWKQAQGWLNDGRWADETNQPVSKPVSPERQQVFVNYDSEEWHAWQAYWWVTRCDLLKPMQTKEHGYGRYFPSKLPPTNSEEAA